VEEAGLVDCYVQDRTGGSLDASGPDDGEAARPHGPVPGDFDGEHTVLTAALKARRHCHLPHGHAVDEHCLNFQLSDDAVDSSVDGRAHALQPGQLAAIFAYKGSHVLAAVLPLVWSAVLNVFVSRVVGGALEALEALFTVYAEDAGNQPFETAAEVLVHPVDFELDSAGGGDGLDNAYRGAGFVAGGLDPYGDDDGLS
jgi:hypothetical protein